jgi:hypothetical protein
MDNEGPELDDLFWHVAMQTPVEYLKIMEVVGGYVRESVDIRPFRYEVMDGSTDNHVEQPGEPAGMADLHGELPEESCKGNKDYAESPGPEVGS